MPRKYSVKKGGKRQRGGFLTALRDAAMAAVGTATRRAEEEAGRARAAAGRFGHNARRDVASYNPMRQAAPAHHAPAPPGSHLGVRGGRRTRRRSRGGSGKGNGQSHKASGLTSDGTYLDMLNSQSQTGGRKGKHPKKGQRSRTMKGKEDFTTKRGNRFFDRDGHRRRHARRSRKIRLPYEGGTHPKKGQLSRTHRGDKDFTTKKGDKDYHKNRHDEHLPDKPYMGGGCGCAGGLPFF